MASLFHLADPSETVAATVAKALVRADTVQRSPAGKQDDCRASDMAKDAA